MLTGTVTIFMHECLIRAGRVDAEHWVLTGCFSLHVYIRLLTFSSLSAGVIRLPKNIVKFQNHRKAVLFAGTEFTIKH